MSATNLELRQAVSSSLIVVRSWLKPPAEDILLDGFMDCTEAEYDDAAFVSDIFFLNAPVELVDRFGGIFAKSLRNRHGSLDPIKVAAWRSHCQDCGVPHVAEKLLEALTGPLEKAA